MNLGLRLCVLMLAVTGIVLSAQTAATKSDAEVQKEDQQAEASINSKTFWARCRCLKTSTSNGRRATSSGSGWR